MDKEIEALIKHAIHVGEGRGKVLDFSDESIRSVSEILNFYHELYTETSENIIKEQPDTFSHIFGAYVGEVLRQNYAPHWAWARTEYGLVLAKNEQNMVNPIGKAYKHIVNGSDDDIYSFFTVAIAVVQEKFPSQNATNS